MTLISSSPLLEHDAQYMEVIFTRSYYKKLQKKHATEKSSTGD